MLDRLRYLWSVLNAWDRTLLGLLLLIYAHNLVLGIMEVDAMQYAGISKEMAQTGQYLQVHEFGRDYLDKPPLLFWLSSWSMLLFGFHDWSYKLPSVLVLLLSAYAVFRWALVHYTPRIAKNAMLVWMTCQAFFQMTNDVRTDGLLASFVVISLWLFSDFFEKKDFKKFLLGSAAIGLAMLAKGPIGMVAVLLPIGLDLMVRGRWRDVFHPRWGWMFLVVGILLAPMLWGLYQQFDLHPEKEVYGLKGPSGIWFYFWTQSFGRITGENYWNDGSPWHFFLGSIWWDFFPWVLLLFPAIYQRIRHWNSQKEYTSFFGFVLIFVMLSMSRYKLPHYIFVTFPAATLLVASYTESLNTKTLRILTRVGFILGSIVLLVVWAWPVWCFPPLSLKFCLLWAVAFLSLFLVSRYSSAAAWVSSVMFSLLIIPLFMSWQLYPDLLPYQVSSQVGHQLASPEMKGQHVKLLDMDSHAIDFYSPYPVLRNHGDEHIFDTRDTVWVITDPVHLQHIEQIQILKQSLHVGFHITRLSPANLLASSRPSQLTDSLVLAQITKLVGN